MRLSEVRDSLPQYTIIKDKLDVAGLDLEAIFSKLKSAFAGEKLNDIDGLKLTLNRAGYISENQYRTHCKDLCRSAH